MMAETVIPGPTILDYLNEDCWHAVLDYVHLTDIIGTEQASHNWQRVMLTYLRGLRFIIETPNLFFHEKLRNARRIVAEQDLNGCSFESWTYKLGPSVVAICCDSEDTLKIIKDNCPNI